MRAQEDQFEDKDLFEGLMANFASKAPGTSCSLYSTLRGVGKGKGHVFLLVVWVEIRVK